MSAPLVASAELLADIQRKGWNTTPPLSTPGSHGGGGERGPVPLKSPLERPRVFAAELAPELLATIPDAPVRARAARKASRLVPRQRPRSPDRQASRDRRRCLGGSNVLPGKLRCNYTEGQRAVLCIIAGEVKHRGICDMPIDKIAALAGVCRTTVQTTLHEARRLGHLRITERPVRGRKSLTNLVEITSLEWRTWIKRGPTEYRPIGSSSMNLVSSSKSKEDDTFAAVTKIAQPSDLAIQLAIDVAKIAGHDPERLPTSWTVRNPNAVVQSWIDRLKPWGIKPEYIRNLASHVMKRKPDSEPPRSVRYFEPTVVQIVHDCTRAAQRCAETERRAQAVRSKGA